ncbi:MAG TPA: MerR family transcriptional regulator, partial [Nocardioides sp.]|uniref:MerR family transcriptional regulator n=1 Tax=Nocardioides sp. TaxID=35761 RepID=UPI002D7FD29F
MSELAARTGLPVPTIKYYLREGLLPPGESIGATRAHYDDTHVRRLRLVRALIEVAGLRLEDVRRVLDAIDDEDLSWHEAVG